MGVRVGAEEHVGPFWISASTRVGKHRRNTRHSMHLGWIILVAVLLTAVHAGWIAILLTGIVMAGVQHIVSRHQSSRR